MNIPKKYLGKFVEITWRDPNYGKGPIEGLIVGRAALATWKEYGVIHDITDGVVLIAHSYGQDVGADGWKPDEVARTAVDEAVIENIIVYVPEAPQA